ncbi:MAG: hypothetical protein K9H58_16090, partial [Bacteroidales bacterium]|nr:hypothetical protein [Bacteroidales bacterium]
NAATATALATPRDINGVAFDGTADITVTAAAGTLTGNTLNATVVNSSLTSVGTLTDLTVTNAIAGSVTGTAANVTGVVAIANGGTGASTQQAAIDALAGSTTSGQFLRGDGTNVSMSAIQVTDVPTLNQNTSGNAATATALETARDINGVAFDGTADITVTAAAGTLTGNTLNATVVNSSLTSVGTLTDLTVTNAIAGSVTGTAANVTGTVAIANGGTGATTQQAAIDALAGSTTSGQFLRGDGTNVSMSAIQVADVPTLNQNTTGNAATATTATHLASGAAGTIPYQSAANTTAMLAAGTSGQVLTSGGAGAPTWEDPAVNNYANPSVSAGLTAINGTATTAMRSDAAPAINQAIVPTWTGEHRWDEMGTFSKGITAYGADLFFNFSYLNNTNINTGTSTGTVTIGGTADQTISIGDGGGAKTVTLGSNTLTSTTTIEGGSGGINIGTSAVANTVTIGNAAGEINIPKLTASRPVKTDGSNNLISATIDLSSSNDVGASVLPIANGGTGQTAASAAFDALSPMSSTGDIIYGGASGTATRLAAGSADMVLTSNGAAAPSWNYPKLSSSENYLAADRVLVANNYSTALSSITLDAGTWLITCEATFSFSSASNTYWNATLVLGTSAANAYTSGNGSTRVQGGAGPNPIQISLSKIVTLGSTTTISTYGAANVAATVVVTPPVNPSTAGTATGIHAVRIQ